MNELGKASQDDAAKGIEGRFHPSGSVSVAPIDKWLAGVRSIVQNVMTVERVETFGKSFSSPSRRAARIVLPNYTFDLVHHNSLVGQVDLFREMSVRKLRGGALIGSLKRVFSPGGAVFVARPIPPIYDQPVALHSASLLGYITASNRCLFLPSRCVCASGNREIMRNFTWVCFRCRTATRRSPVAKDVRCRSCAQPCECIGYTPVPFKLRAREWDALHETIYRARRAHLFEQQKRRVARIHGLEREIARLESMPANNGGADAVKRLRKKLEQFRDPSARIWC